MLNGKGMFFEKRGSDDGFSRQSTVGQEKETESIGSRQSQVGRGAFLTVGYGIPLVEGLRAECYGIRYRHGLMANYKCMIGRSGNGEHTQQIDTVGEKRQSVGSR